MNSSKKSGKKRVPPTTCHSCKKVLNQKKAYLISNTNFYHMTPDCLKAFYVHVVKPHRKDFFVKETTNVHKLPMIGNYEGRDV